MLSMSSTRPTVKTFGLACPLAVPPALTATTTAASSSASPATAIALRLMVVPPRPPRPGRHLLDVRTYLSYGGREQATALLRGGHSRVAHHAAAAKAGPVRPDRERPVGPVQPHVFGVPVRDLAHRLVHLHELWLEREVDRRLELAGVRHPARLR